MEQKQLYINNSATKGYAFNLKDSKLPSFSFSNSSKRDAFRIKLLKGNTLLVNLVRDTYCEEN